MKKRPEQTVVHVALNVPFADHLDYLCRDAVPVVGARVLVPLQRRGAQVGVVVGHARRSAQKNLKAVQRVLDAAPLLDDALLAFYRRVARYYLVSLGEVVFTALPRWFRRTDDKAPPQERWWRALSAQATKPMTELEQRIHAHLVRHGPLMSRQMTGVYAGAARVCRQLQNKNLIESSDLGFVDSDSVTEQPFELTRDQRAAVEALQQQGDGFATSLLDGITGSGKTEVYIHRLQDCLKRGKQALVLVPEIGLTPQLFTGLNGRIHGRIAVLHSGLSDGARARVWWQASRAEIDVVVATRSGLFTPFSALGLIIVDEEHDASYKQQEGMRYSARDMAVLRGLHQNVPVILGSATPALETLNNALSGRYHWLRLQQRTNSKPLPTITLHSIKNQAMHNGLSQQVLKRIEEHLQQGHQVLVFLNRRGWSPRLMCYACGWIAMCDHCDSHLTVHRKAGHLRCHHCEKIYSMPEFCPDCGSQKVNTSGVGTERLEKGLMAAFGEAAVIRIDRDTVKTGQQWQKQIDRIREEKPCVIVGTQMLSKGHDFPRLSLVVVVNVDEQFFSSDFRATEHLAQLLVQVSGRAGRAATRGEVMIQTLYPQHEFFQQLLQQGYHAFAKHNLALRREHRFPPASYMAIVRARHSDAQRLDDFLLQALERLPHDPAVNRLGPVDAPMHKKNNRFNRQILFNAAARSDIHRLMKQFKGCLQQAAQAHRGVLWSIDLDPLDLT